MSLDELRSVCLPPLCHLLHEVLFSSAMWYFLHPAVQFRATGVELMKQRYTTPFQFVSRFSFRP